MYVTNVIRTSVFYPHIRTQHRQILSAFYPLPDPLITHSPRVLRLKLGKGPGLGTVLKMHFRI